MDSTNEQTTAHLPYPFQESQCRAAVKRLHQKSLHSEKTTAVTLTTQRTDQLAPLLKAHKSSKTYDRTHASPCSHDKSTIATEPHSRQRLSGRHDICYHWSSEWVMIGHDTRTGVTVISKSQCAGGQTAFDERPCLNDVHSCSDQNAVAFSERNHASSRGGSEGVERRGGQGGERGQDNMVLSPHTGGGPDRWDFLHFITGTHTHSRTHTPTRTHTYTHTHTPQKGYV